MDDNIFHIYRDSTRCLGTMSLTIISRICCSKRCRIRLIRFIFTPGVSALNRYNIILLIRTEYIVMFMTGKDHFSVLGKCKRVPFRVICVIIAEIR